MIKKLMQGFTENIMKTNHKKNRKHSTLNMRGKRGLKVNDENTKCVEEELIKNGP